MKKRVVTALIIISLLISPLAAAAEEGAGKFSGIGTGQHIAELFRVLQ